MNEIIPFEGEFTKNEIQTFNEQYLAMMENLANTTLEIKRLQDDQKKAKAVIGKAMDEYGIKSIDNKFVKIIRVAGSDGKETIDLDALKKEEPELYEELLADYPTITGKKAPSVRFDVKGVK